MLITYTYLAIAIVSEVIGTSLLKSSNGFTVLLPSLGVIIAYALSFIFLSKAIQFIPIGVAYAIWSGAGVVAITIIARIFFHQKLDAAAILGMGLIVAGVLVIHLFSKSSGH